MPKSRHSTLRLNVACKWMEDGVAGRNAGTARRYTYCLTHSHTHMYIYKQKRAKQKGASHLGHLQCVTCCIFNGSCGCWEQGVTNHLQNLRYFLVEDIYLQVCMFMCVCYRESYSFVSSQLKLGMDRNWSSTKIPFIYKYRLIMLELSYVLIMGPRKTYRNCHASQTFRTSINLKHIKICTSF